jgi:hypothetical protein
MVEGNATPSIGPSHKRTSQVNVAGGLGQRAVKSALHEGGIVLIVNVACHTEISLIESVYPVS